MSLIAPQWLEPHLDTWNEFARTTQLVDWTAWATIVVAGTLAYSVWQSRAAQRLEAGRAAALLIAYGERANLFAQRLGRYTRRRARFTRGVAVRLLLAECAETSAYLAHFEISKFPTGGAVHDAIRVRQLVGEAAELAQSILDDEDVAASSNLDIRLARGRLLRERFRNGRTIRRSVETLVELFRERARLLERSGSPIRAIFSELRVRHHKPPSDHR